MTQYRVVIRYDDPRGGAWRGPWESLDKVNERAKVESSRARGTVRIERMPQVFDDGMGGEYRPGVVIDV